MEQAQALVDQLEQSDEAGTERDTARQKAAQERAARERVECLEAALVEMPVVKAAKKAAERESSGVKYGSRNPGHKDA